MENHERIGDLLLATLSGFSRGLRRSGRTTRMVEDARRGDIFVMASAAERVHLETLLHRAGKRDGIGVVSVEVGSVQRLWDDLAQRTRGRQPCRVILDDGVVEAVFAAEVAMARNELGSLVRSLSSPPYDPGTGHIER